MPTRAMTAPYGACLVAALALCACDGGESSSAVSAQQPNPFNRAPVCNAGREQLIVSVGVPMDLQLDGSGSYDPDGDILSFAWRSNCGTFTLSGPISSTPIMSVAFHASDLDCWVQLIVDDGLLRSTCYAKIEVVPDLPIPLQSDPDAAPNEWGVCTACLLAPAPLSRVVLEQRAGGELPFGRVLVTASASPGRLLFAGPLQALRRIELDPADVSGVEIAIEDDQGARLSHERFEFGCAHALGAEVSKGRFEITDAILR